MEREPEQQHVEAILITGISTRTKNENEQSEKTGLIPGLWQRFFQQQLNEKISHQVAQSPVYGVYHAYESDLCGEYTVTAGMAVTNENNSAYDSVTIAAGNYLVFRMQGDMPQSVIGAWQWVWDYFSSNTQVTRSYTTDFERYDGPDSVSLYIAIAT